MPTDTKCPACGRDGARQLDEPVRDRDAVWISCPRCGDFAIDVLAPAAINHGLRNDRHRLSYALRAASDRGEKIFLDAETAPRLVDSAPRYAGIDDGVDLLLLQISGRAKRYMDQIDAQPAMDYTRVPVRDEAEYSDLYGLACDMGYIDRNTRRITVAGWRRLEVIRTVTTGRRQAFVAMWFSPTTDDAWERGFTPGISRSGYFSPFRIDRKEHNNKIDDEIVAEIRRSGLLVADFTGQRGGVYFEAGLAQGLGLPVIWTCRSDDIGNAHFDTRQYSHILWDSPEELADSLDKRIRATVLPVGYLPTA